MHARWIECAVKFAAVLWLTTIMSAELMHAAIEADSHAAQRECPVCLFHSTHGQVQQPEAVLKPVLALVLTESVPLPAYAYHLPDTRPAFHQSIRSPPVAML